MTKKSFPKYFVHASSGFQDGTIYIIVKNNKVGYCVLATGKGEDFPPTSAFGYVKLGYWKEVSQRTAQRRLKKAKQDERSESY